MVEKKAREATELLAKEVKRLHIELAKSKAGLDFLLDEICDADAKARLNSFIKQEVADEAIANGVRIFDDIALIWEE